MRIFALPLLALAFTLGGCQSVPPRGTATPAAPKQAAKLHGRASYLERMQLPADAVLEVQLLGERAADTSTSVLAEQRFTRLHGPPYEFELAYDPTRIDADMHCSLRATLRRGDGHLEFVTERRVPVTPGSGETVEFRLVRAGGG
jgi:putative lipoprotein